jgi:hypothetical protein
VLCKFNHRLNSPSLIPAKLCIYSSIKGNGIVIGVLAEALVPSCYHV